MLTAIHPKLPMSNKAITKEFYENKLGFRPISDNDFDAYLMLKKDAIEIHFFVHENIDLATNYAQVYIRVVNIEKVYQQFILNGVAIHPNGHLSLKPWQQKEFSILDPDNNLLTFGEAL